LTDLATSDPKAGVIKIKDIARREKIPAKFLEQILLSLNAGLLHSKTDAGGDYYLA
jgi:DNA-binding IscR family transcriptional regulator